MSSKRRQVSHDHRSFERNLSNCKQKPEKVRTSTEFEPVTSRCRCDALTNCDMSDPTPVKILRDTGASQSLLLSDILLFSEESSVGASVLIRGINCSEYSPVPLHNVYLKSNLVTGPVKVGIQPSLPFEGVHLIL